MKNYETERMIVKYVDVKLRIDARENSKLQLIRKGMGCVPAYKLAWRAEGIVYLHPSIGIH